jgi:hypothetical protein
MLFQFFIIIVTLEVDKKLTTLLFKINNDEKRLNRTGYFNISHYQLLHLCQELTENEVVVLYFEVLWNR